MAYRKAASPDSDNYQLGRGQLSVNMLNTNGTYDGIRPVGNAPNFTFNGAVSFLEHFSSMAALKLKDKKIANEIAVTGQMTLEEITPDNMNLLTQGTSETTAQSAADFTYTATSAKKNREYPLGKREVGVYVVAFKTGTAEFTAESTLSGATGGGVIRQVILESGTFVGGDAAGKLLIDTVTAGFVLDEAIADDNGTPGAAVCAAVELISTSLLAVVEDPSGTPVYYIAGTDYEVITGSGYIRFLPDATFTEGTDIVIYGSAAATSYTVVSGFMITEQEAEIHYRSQNPLGGQMDFVGWRGLISANGDFAFIGENWAQIPIQIEFLSSAPKAALGKSPFFEITMPDVEIA